MISYKLPFNISQFKNQTRHGENFLFLFVGSEEEQKNGSSTTLCFQRGSGDSKPTETATPFLLFSLFLLRFENCFEIRYSLFIYHEFEYHLLLLISHKIPNILKSHRAYSKHLIFAFLHRSGSGGSVTLKPI